VLSSQTVVLSYFERTGSRLVPERGHDLPVGTRSWLRASRTPKERHGNDENDGVTDAPQFSRCFFGPRYVHQGMGGLGLVRVECPAVCDH